MESAYEWKGLMPLGRSRNMIVIFHLGLDWPGTNASYYPINPLMWVNAAVTRQTVNGEPKEGWFPEQKISLEEALKAYTAGSAFWCI